MATNIFAGSALRCPRTCPRWWRICRFDKTSQKSGIGNNHRYYSVRACHMANDTLTKRPLQYIPRQCSNYSTSAVYCYNSSSKPASRSSREVIDMSSKLPSHDRRYAKDMKNVPRTKMLSDVELYDKLQDLAMVDTEVEPLAQGKQAAQVMYRDLSRMDWQMALATLQKHHASLDKTHYALTMKRLFRELWSYPHRQRASFKTSVRADPRFELLKALLALKGQYYDAGIVMDMLVFMTHFNVDSTDPAMAVYLHLVKHHLHDLALDQKVRVAWAVSMMTPHPQIDLILQGIKELNSFNPSDIQHLSAFEVVHLLDMFGADLSDKALSATIRQVKDQCDVIKNHLSKVLFRALSRLPDFRWGLIQHCLYWIKLFPDSLVLEDIIDILHSCHRMFFFDPELFKLMTSKIVELGNFEHKISALNLYTELCVSDVTLVSDILDNLSTENIEQLDVSQKFKLIHSLAYSSPSLSDTDTAVGLLTADLDINNSTVRKVDRVSTLLDLHILGHRNEMLLEDVWSSLEGAGSHEERTSDNFSNRLSWLPPSVGHIHQVLHLLTRSHNFSVPQKVVDHVSGEENKLAQMPSLLRGGLELIMGGPEFVWSNVPTEDGLVIDHQVQLSANGEPVSCHQDSSCHARHDMARRAERHDVVHGKELVFGHVNVGPEDTTKSIAFMVLHRTCFHRNTGQLNGHTAWCARQLQQQGHLVVLVNLATWKRVPEPEKAEFLRRKLAYVEQDQDLTIVGMEAY